MRLLRTDTLALEEFFDENVPAYAILSHTWGADELSLQDLQRWQVSKSSRSEDQSSTTTGDVAVKAGFVKVRKAATFAAERRFAYLWVDTCCIDKTSSAELRTSGSRWFTRGWTLQELIAPRALLFLARDWSVLGNKRNNPALIDVVANITGVPVTVLLGKARPGNISVASRLQWASERQTTRAEDIAYCLLGIFDVNMPLLYGEGQRAFVRLQEAILKSTQSLIKGLSNVDTYQPEFARQVDYSDRWGRSPLWHAAATGATAAVTALLELGAHVNLMDDEGLTPLHAAARGGHEAALQTLLNRGASPRFDTQLFGLTPLHLAVLFGHRKCVFWFLSFFARDGPAAVRNVVNLGIQTKAIHLAAASGHLDMVQELQRAGAVVDTACDECLRVVDEGGGDWAQLVPGASNVEAVAERYGHQDIVAFLRSLKSKSTVNMTLPPRPESELRCDPRSNYPALPLTVSSAGFQQVPHSSSFSRLYPSTQPILEATHLQTPYVQSTQPSEHIQYLPPPALTHSPVRSSETAYYYDHPSQPYQLLAPHPLYQAPQTYPPPQIYQSYELYQTFPTNSQYEPSQQSQWQEPSVTHPPHQSYPLYQPYQLHETRQPCWGAGRRVDGASTIDADMVVQAQYLERFEAEMSAGAVLFSAEGRPILELDCTPLPVRSPGLQEIRAVLESASIMRKKWEQTRHQLWERNPPQEWSTWGYHAADFWKGTELLNEDDAIAVEPSKSTTSSSSTPGSAWNQLMMRLRNK
ncbi:hypothetical protein CHU98_g7595 [Xylaria longipes]|nr:hypothetical protein CHU98_g7595 [Xylaria longipes]